MKRRSTIGARVGLLQGVDIKLCKQGEAAQKVRVFEDTVQIKIDLDHGC
jgi:hypothetical protein